MNNSVIVVRGGVSYAYTNFGCIYSAMRAAKEDSLRFPDAKVYCVSSDRAMRLVQALRAVGGRITDIVTRYCGKVVTDEETIPDELWDKFNEKRR